jgi:hypothetical protein
MCLQVAFVLRIGLLLLLLLLQDDVGLLAGERQQQ